MAILRMLMGFVGWEDFKQGLRVSVYSRYIISSHLIKKKGKIENTKRPGLLFYRTTSPNLNIKMQQWTNYGTPFQRYANKDSRNNNKNENNNEEND
jgi:hypothetical protein